MLGPTDWRSCVAPRALVLLALAICLLPTARVSGQPTPADSARDRVDRLDASLDAKLSELADAEVGAPARLLADAHRIDAERINAIESLNRDAHEQVMGVGLRGRRELERETTLLALGGPI